MVHSQLLKQHDSGVWLGALRSQVANTQFYIGFVQFGLVAITAYHTTLGGWFNIYFPWVTPVVFVLLGVLLYGIIMLLDYKFVLPSLVAFGNRQSYAHENPVKEDLVRVLKELEYLKKESAFMRSQIGEDINLM